MFHSFISPLVKLKLSLTLFWVCLWTGRGHRYFWSRRWIVIMLMMINLNQLECKFWTLLFPRWIGQCSFTVHRFCVFNKITSLLQLLLLLHVLILSLPFWNFFFIVRLIDLFVSIRLYLILVNFINLFLALPPGFLSIVLKSFPCVLKFSLSCWCL